MAYCGHSLEMGGGMFWQQPVSAVAQRRTERHSSPTLRADRVKVSLAVGKPGFGSWRPRTSLCSSGPNWRSSRKRAWPWASQRGTWAADTVDRGGSQAGQWQGYERTSSAAHEDALGRSLNTRWGCRGVGGGPWEDSGPRAASCS